MKTNEEDDFDIFGELISEIKRYEKEEKERPERIIVFGNVDDFLYQIDPNISEDEKHIPVEINGIEIDYVETDDSFCEVRIVGEEYYLTQ